MVPWSLMAQVKGIQYQENRSWPQVLKTASTAEKYLFVDCYATWCGPCRYMDDSILSQLEVADYMNHHFINVKVQMDTPKNLIKNVNDQNNYAIEIKRKFEVTSYPTYLFLNPSGELVYKTIGVFDAPSFLAKAQKALDSDEQYFFLLEEYNRGHQGVLFLRQLMNAAKRAGDEEMAERIRKVNR